MNKPVVGMVVGTVLGVLDGLSAWFSPEARSMMAAIVVGSTLKGLLTGFLAGLVARRRRSLAAGVVAGAGIGVILSSIAAVGQMDHYAEIVLPGMLVGAVAGFAAQRYPRMRDDSGRGGTLAVVIAGGLACSQPLAITQTATTADSLAPLAGLLGRWAGTSEGQPGRQRIVFRQFHVEGFLNQYVAEPATAGARLVLVTEAIENIPSGWRARETYQLTGADRLEETFELAEPGKDFEVYSRTRLIRAR